MSPVSLTRPPATRMRIRQGLGWLAALAGFVFLVSQPGAGRLLGIVGGGVGLIAWAGARLSLAALAVSVEIRQKRITEGEAASVSVVVRNRLPLPIWGVWLELPDGLEIGGTGGSRVTLDPIGPLGRMVVELTVRAVRRGMYPSRPPVLRSGYPFGLSVRTRPVRCVESLTVWPRVFATAQPLAGGRSHTTDWRARPVRAGNDGDVFGIREYRPGEPLGRVHWPQTARRGTVIVCEREDLPATPILILLDVNADWCDASGGEEAFDWAVRATGSLVRSCVEAGRFVSLKLGPGEALTARGPADLPRLFDRLATVERREAGSGPPLPRDSGGGQLIVTDDAGFERLGGGRAETGRAWVLFAMSGESGRADATGVWRRVDWPEQSPEALAPMRTGVARAG